MPAEDAASGSPNMNRNIPNKPHPTPDPEKPHTAEAADRANFAVFLPGVHANPDHSAESVDELGPDEASYDSCFDDLNQVLSQSMEQPDPDPNLESLGAGVRHPDGADSRPGRDRARRGKTPRTSEIFRAVVASGGGPAVPDGPTGPTGPAGHLGRGEPARPGRDRQPLRIERLRRHRGIGTRTRRSPGARSRS